MSDQAIIASDEDLATLLTRREHARPTRVTWILLTLLVLVVGFVAGAAVSQRLGAGANSGVPSGFPAGMPMGVTVGPAGAAPLAGMTVGTVKLLDGRNLYLTTTSGETVKVTVPDTVIVTTQQDVDLADLEAGSTVIIRGTTAADGTVTADSVSEGSLPGAPAPTTQGEN